MHRYIILLVNIILFVLTVIPHVSYALGLEIGAGYMRQEPSGDLAYKPLSSIDTLDIERDLGYEREYRLFGRIKAETPLFLPNVYLFATPITFEETGSKTENFTFGDISFDATLPFDSRVEMDLYDVCLYYSLPFLDKATLGKLNAEIGLNARIIDFNAEISGRDFITGLTATESVSKIIPVPMIYAAIQLNPVDFLSIEAEGRGVAYSSNHYYDIIGRIKIKPIGPLFIAGGYRYNDIKIDYSDVEASIKFSGPFVETGFVF
jgi:outer membrane protein